MSVNSSSGFTQGTTQGTSNSTSTGGSQGQSTGNSQSSSFVPDQQPQMDFLTQFGNTAGQLGSQQYDWAQNQFNHNSDVTDQNVDSYLQNSDMASQGAQRDFENYNDIFNPAASSLTNDWQSYTSPDRVNSEMGRSEAGVAQNFDAQRANTERGLRSYGINPSDPRYAGAMAASRTAQAASEAGAGTQARLNTEATGRQLRQSALNEAHLLPGQAATEQNVAMQGNTGAQNAALSNTSTGALTLGTTPNYLNAGINDVKFSPLGNQSTSANQSTNSSSNNSTSNSQNTGQNTGQNNSSGMSAGSGPGSSGANNGSRGSGASQPNSNGSYSDGTRPMANNGTQAGSSAGRTTSVPYTGPGAGASTTNLPDTGGGNPDNPGDPNGSYDVPNQYGPPNPFDTSGDLPLPNTQPGYPDQYSTDLGISMNEWQQGGNGGGGEGWAQGGAIPDGDGDEGGGMVPASMSPSGGQQTDDIPAVINQTGGQAHINAGEFVIPQDVVQWNGHKFFQDLIMKSRKARQMNPGPAHPTMQGGSENHDLGGNVGDPRNPPPGGGVSANVGDFEQDGQTLQGSPDVMPPPPPQGIPDVMPPPPPRPPVVSDPGPSRPMQPQRRPMGGDMPPPSRMQPMPQPRPAYQPRVIASMKNYQAGNRDQAFHPQASYAAPTPKSNQPRPQFTPVQRQAPAPAPGPGGQPNQSPGPAAPTAPAPTPAPAAPPPSAQYVTPWGIREFGGSNGPTGTPVANPTTNTGALTVGGGPSGGGAPQQTHFTPEQLGGLSSNKALRNEYSMNAVMMR